MEHYSKAFFLNERVNPNEPLSSIRIGAVSLSSNGDYVITSADQLDNAIVTYELLDEVCVCVCTWLCVVVVCVCVCVCLCLCVDGRVGGMVGGKVSSVSVSDSLSLPHTEHSDVLFRQAWHAHFRRRTRIRRWEWGRGTLGESVLSSLCLTLSPTHLIQRCQIRCQLSASISALACRRPCAIHPRRVADGLG